MHNINYFLKEKKITRASITVLTAVAGSLLLISFYVLIWHRKGQKLYSLLCKMKSSRYERNIEALIASHGLLAPKSTSTQKQER